MKFTNTCSLILLVLGLSFSATTAQAEPTPDQLQNLLKQKTTPIVTIDAVIKVSRNIGDKSRSTQQELTVHGVVIDERGTILTSATPFSSQSRTIRNKTIKSEKTPTDLEVRFKNKSDTHKAFLGATDDRFNVAFLQLRNPDALSVDPIQLEQEATPQVGERVVWTSRQMKSYDFAPYFSLSRINGRVSKPRKMWSLSSAPKTGLPIYNMEGELLGISGQVDTGADLSRQQQIQQMLGTGGGYLVPINDVKKVYQRAKQQIKQTRKKIEENRSESDEE